MLPMTHEVSVKGKIQRVPAVLLDDIVIVTKGQLIRVGEVFDECWLDANSLPDPFRVLERLRDIDQKPDIFTFAQRVPDTQPHFPFHMEWDNMAVIQVSSYDVWFREQISRSSQKAIRAGEKKGVVVREDLFNEKYIRGVMSIYNESPIRHGRKYWHYGKDFSAVQSENGTYRERSTFLGAYFNGEMIGYMKIIWDLHSASIMQIVSKMAFLDKRPNNAFLSEAVKLCSERGIKYLFYGPFVYGSKGEDSLTSFKKANGFIKVNLPRYYVPLTSKGGIALRLGLHKNPKDMMPQWLRTRFINIRDKWYSSLVSGG